MSFELTFQAFPAPDGPVHFAPIPWDSDLYGFPVYELSSHSTGGSASGGKSQDTPPELLAQHLPAWLAGLPADRPCLVYSKIPPGAVPRAQVLAGSGFYPVETLVEFHLRLARLAPIVRGKSETKRLRPADPADQPRVTAIAATAFATDRYHLDTHLPAGKADQRFIQWINRSFAAQEPIFVLEDTARAQVLGFVQCRPMTPQLMDVTLGSVDKALQQTGAGVLMYQLLFIEFKARGYREAVTRVSLHNIGGIKLTLRLGFTVRSAVTTLHWFRPAGG